MSSSSVRRVFLPLSLCRRPCSFAHSPRASAEGENFDPKDFENFAKQSKITISPVASAHIVGPNDPTAPQDESTLDIEMIGGVNTEADNWFWLEKGNGWLYAFVSAGAVFAALLLS